MTIIDWINQLLVYKKPWDTFSETEQKKFSPFIVNRFLSMDKEFIEVVNYFKIYSIGTLEQIEVYKWYCDFLPKGKRFNKYIKGKKIKKYDELLIKTLCTYFECNKKQVCEYIELLDKNEIRNILEMYGIEEKQIKKVIK